MRWVILCALILAACKSSYDRAPANAPLPYKHGFADGCDSGYNAAGHVYYSFTKDVERYATTPFYAQGWDDGFAVCKGKYDSLGP